MKKPLPIALILNNDLKITIKNVLTSFNFYAKYFKMFGASSRCDRKVQEER